MAETLSNKKGNKKDNKKGKKSNLSSQTTGGDFPFLSLPAEIRLMIYYEIRLPSNIHLPRPRLPASVKALLRINGIRSELLVLMGQKCHFHRCRAKYYRSVMSSSLPTWSAFVKYALPHIKKLSLTVPSFFCGWHWLMNRELSEILRSLRVRQLDRHRDKPLPWNLQHLTIMEAIRSGHSWEHVPTASSPHTEAICLGSIRAIYASQVPRLRRRCPLVHCCPNAGDLVPSSHETFRAANFLGTCACTQREKALQGTDTLRDPGQSRIK